MYSSVDLLPTKGFLNISPKCQLVEVQKYMSILDDINKAARKVVNRRKEGLVSATYYLGPGQTRG